MAAGKYNFTIEQGATLVKTFDFSEVYPTLTGYTARLQARETIASSTKILDLTSSDALSINASTRIITLTLPATTTATLTFSTAVYDLELITGTTVNRPIEGVITNSLEVTR